MQAYMSLSGCAEPVDGLTPVMAQLKVKHHVGCEGLLSHGKNSASIYSLHRHLKTLVGSRLIQTIK
jgi:hypothetical protein